MPELSAFVGEELQKEAKITKGHLKVVELREQVRKMQNPRNSKGKDE